MKKIGFALLLLACILLTSLSGFIESVSSLGESEVISHIVDPLNQKLKFYWKNENNISYKNFQNLKLGLEKENEELIFAMNGGMYNPELAPQGLFIENGVTKTKIDTVKNEYGNFYLQPNGIFYLTNEDKAVICITEMFENSGNVKYATQSGPMLLINGQIHSKFNEGSPYVNIRNGVGILPDGKILFAMSKEQVNFYDFASYLKQNGCKNALYLDGFVSRAYVPSKNWMQMDGNFGVIIGETKIK